MWRVTSACGVFRPAAVQPRFRSSPSASACRSCALCAWLFPPLPLESCAYRLCDRQQYLQTCLELSGSHVTNGMEQRTLAQTNFHGVIAGNAPQPPLRVDAIEAWGTTSADGGEITIDMSELGHCIDCKVILVSETAATVDFALALRSQLPMPITFSALGLEFSSNEYSGDSVTLAGDAAGSSIVLVPDTVKVVRGTISSPIRAEHPLQVTSVNLSLPSASLQWPIAVPPVNPSAVGLAGLDALAGQPWHAIPAVPRTQVKGRNQLVQIATHHEPPVLVGEVYSLALKISNDEAVAIKSCVLELQLSEQPGTNSFTAGQVVHGDDAGASISVSVGDVAAGSTHTVDVSLRFTETAKCSLQGNLKYVMPLSGESTTGREDGKIPWTDTMVSTRRGPQPTAHLMPRPPPLIDSIRLRGRCSRTLPFRFRPSTRLMFNSTCSPWHTSAWILLTASTPADRSY